MRSTRCGRSPCALLRPTAREPHRGRLGRTSRADNLHVAQSRKAVTTSAFPSSWASPPLDRAPPWTEGFRRHARIRTHPARLPLSHAGRAGRRRRGGALTLHAIAAPVADLLPELVALRRDLHAHPELASEERRTAGLVAQALRPLPASRSMKARAAPAWSARSRSGSGTRSVGLRADMDALPMAELGRAAHASRTQGVHHGCGHDGHHQHADRRRAPAGAHAALRRHGALHLPAGRRRQGAARASDDRGRSVRALPPATASGRCTTGPTCPSATYNAGRPDHGRGRPLRHRAARSRRPCGAAASHAGRDPRCQSARCAAAHHRFAPHRPGRIGGAVGHAHRRRPQPQRAAGPGGRSPAPCAA